MEKDDKGAGAAAATDVVPVDETAPKAQAKKPSSKPSFFQTAILKIRRYTSCSKPAFDDGPKSPVAQDDGGGGGGGAKLRSIVDGMRPLHLQPDNSRRPPPPPLPPAGCESFHDVSHPPISPDTMSRYASMEDLPAFDVADQDGGAADGSKNSVDVMADEFIANFYEQMRLQRLESMSRHGDDETCRSPPAHDRVTS